MIRSFQTITLFLVTTLSIHLIRSSSTVFFKSAAQCYSAPQRQTSTADPTVSKTMAGYHQITLQKIRENYEKNQCRAYKNHRNRYITYVRMCCASYSYVTKCNVSARCVEKLRPVFESKAAIVKVT